MAAANDIVMPKLGLTMSEGVLSEWLVAPGDTVDRGQIMFVVETDKLATEVEATGPGEIVELVAAAGETLPVGAVVARWTGEGAAPAADGGGAAPAPEDTTAGAAQGAVPNENGASVGATPPPDAAPPSANGERVIATPLARRVAKSLGVDLGVIAGSGAGGRIKARDVEAAVPAGGSTPPSSARSPLPSPEPSRIAPTALQATVARRLSEAKRDIPHFYLAAEADAGALLAARAQLNADGAKRKLSVNHFILAAVARAWADHPEANRIWEDGSFLALPRVDVGLAVDTPKGLFAPVIRGADRLGLDALAEAADAIAEKARAGRLGGDDLAGGAVTVSNVGMHAVTYLTPIVNPGQSAILGVGTIRKTFRPDAHDRPVPRSEIGLVLACDHRVFNGVAAARLLGAIVAYLEQPLRLLRT